MKGPGSLSSRLGALLLVAMLLSTAAPVRAEEEEESTAYGAVTGLGAALCTLVYAPLKIAYAAGGSLISGLAWAWTLGDTDVAGPILRSAVRGDYVVSPAQLEGRQELRFVGSQY